MTTDSHRGGSRLFSFQACRALDADSLGRGFSEIQLMGQAALASFYRLRDSGALERVREGEGRIHVLCGPGNNGGDGYAFAYHLLGAGPAWTRRLRVYRSGPAKSEAARLYSAQLEACGVALLPGSDFAPQSEAGFEHDLIIEALLGIGQTSAPRGLIGDMLARITRLRSATRSPGLIALDVPAGLREDEASLFIGAGTDLTEATVEAFPAPDEIHSYGVDKVALRLNPSLCALSRILVLPMGFHPESRRLAADAEEVKVAGWRAKVSATDFRKGALDHKYVSGHGVLVGGSPGMEGAAMLAGSTFFAAGGGILHLAAMNEDSRALITAAHPTFMVRVAGSQAFDLNPAAVLVGPGLVKSDLDRLRPDLLRWFGTLPDSTMLILDAGALELILDANFPDDLRGRTLLTPHSGEWRRLGGPSVSNTLSGLQAALEWSRRRLKCFVLLKDAVSCLLTPEPAPDSANDTDCLVSSAPDGNLSVAGSGDVLAGILLARFARRASQGPDQETPAEKIQASVLLHGNAARDRMHPRSEDFPDLIRAALEQDTIQDRSGARPV